MGTSLTGLKIKDSYSGLLKTTDNGGLGASAKQLTDGLGTGSPLYLSTTGLGIGADAGIAKVKITKDNTAGNALEISNSGESRSLDINHNADGTGIVDDIVRISNNGSRKFTINSSGNVGIGITPSYKLHINTDSVAGKQNLDAINRTAQNFIRITNPNFSADSSIGMILRVFPDSDSRQGAGIIASGGASNSQTDVSLFVTNSSDVSYSAYRIESDVHKFYKSPSSEAMRIDSSGNVGIGEQNPLAKIHSKVANDGAASNVVLLQNSGTLSGTESRLFFLQGGTITRGAYISGYNESSSGSPTSLIFATSAAFATPTERMRITSGGYLKASVTGSYSNPTGTWSEFNDNTANTTLQLVNTNASGDGMQVILNSSDTTNYFFNGYSSSASAYRIYIYSNGNIVNSNNSYGAISDIKHKENIEDATPKLDDLMKVKIRNFNMIGETNKQIGVVAQELEEVFPSMIDESTDFEEREVELKDENGEIVYETEQVLVSEEVAEVTEEVLHEAIAEELDEEGNIIVEAQEAWTETIIVTPFQEAVYETVTTDRPVMTTERVDLGTTTKSVKYSVFVPMLIKAIQELKAEVDALKGA